MLSSIPQLRFHLLLFAAVVVARVIVQFLRQFLQFLDVAAAGRVVLQFGRQFPQRHGYHLQVIDGVNR